MIAKEARQVFEIPMERDGFALFLAASGYESRGPHAAERLLNGMGDITKLVFGFAEHKEVASRIHNDEEFQRLGFEMINDVPSRSGRELANTLRAALREASGDKLRVVIDYSCMTKTWYAAIVRELFDTGSRGIVVDVYFVYSTARYAPPGPPGVNKIAGAIAGFGHISSPLKPSALILGLGYEAVRAMGLRDYIDPKLTIAFYTDPALDENYQSAVVRNNAGLLTTLSRNLVFNYAVTDLDYANALLRNVALGLTDRYRVIVAPLGPKPFCLLSLILSAEHPDIDVWRVSVGEEIVPQERAAAGDVLMFKVTFV